MRFPLTFSAVFLFSALLLFSSAAQAGFTGEVLIAPPPPNWTGGTIEKTKAGRQRTWRRTYPRDAASMETIRIHYRALTDGDTAETLATAFAAKQMAACDILTPPELLGRDAEIGSAAFYSLICSRDGVTDFYVDTLTLAGDFLGYIVVREWIGDLDLPSSPVNSPRIAESWDGYFGRIRVCNTLVSDCDVADAERVHADPRFAVMRELNISDRPVLATSDALKVASIFGDLTGRAEACGEDVSPLTGKIERMFDHITQNDQDSSDALSTFVAGQDAGRTAQAARDRTTCGDILREFRAHPSRIGAFYKYAERFL